MTKALKRFGLALGLAALLLGIVGVGAAQAAIPDSDISQSTVHGAWTTAGFWITETVPVDPRTACSFSVNDFETWFIKDGLNVRGIRFTNGVNTGTHCNDATTCRAMYQGT